MKLLKKEKNNLSDDIDNLNISDSSMSNKQNEKEQEEDEGSNNEEEAEEEEEVESDITTDSNVTSVTADNNNATNEDFDNDKYNEQNNLHCDCPKHVDKTDLKTHKNTTNLVSRAGFIKFLKSFQKIDPNDGKDYVTIGLVSFLQCWK